MHRIILVLTLLTLISCQKREETTTVSTTDTLSVSEVQNDPVSKEHNKPNNTTHNDTTVQNPEKPITGNIVLQSPRENDYVDADRFEIKGLARTFENNVVYRVTDLASKQIIAQGFTTAQGEMGTFSPFSVMVTAKKGGGVQYPTRARIEVFEHSAKDGSEINKVSINVRMGEGVEKPNAIEVFFSNPAKGSGDNCRLVFGLPRSIPQTQALARTAIEQLLAGPTQSERSQGFRTEIPGGTRLNSIRIESGVATVDFSSQTNGVAGACKSLAVHAQIERTLRQFSTIKRVEITVNGKTDPWQP